MGAARAVAALRAAQLAMTQRDKAATLKQLRIVSDLTRAAEARIKVAPMRVRMPSAPDESDGAVASRAVAFDERTLALALNDVESEDDARKGSHEFADARFVEAESAQSDQTIRKLTVALRALRRCRK